MEDSRAKACEGMGQDSARLCTPHAGQTGWCNMGTFSWFPFWFPVISLLFFFFFLIQEIISFSLVSMETSL